jgi:hypothetical protein
MELSAREQDSVRQHALKAPLDSTCRSRKYSKCWRLDRTLLDRASPNGGSGG